MKRTIAILFAGLLAVSMSACGAGQDTKQEDSSIQPEVSIAQEESSEDAESFIEEEPEEESQPESKEEDTPSSEAEEPDNNEESGIDPEFKKAMDSYEAFFDDYVDFMKKYQSSDNIAGLMGEYADFLTKYAETMEAFNSVDESTLSEEEALYYVEVSTRISQKLLEVAE